MSRTNLFFKVEVEHDRNEPPEKLAERNLSVRSASLYGVRSAELTNFTAVEE